MSDHLIDRLTSTAHALKGSRAYSASVVEDAIAEITRLRTLLSEAEQREKDARSKALEEAAKVAEEYTFTARMNSLWVRNIQDESQCKPCKLAEAIRALQSEER